MEMGYEGVEVHVLIGFVWIDDCVDEDFGINDGPCSLLA